MLNQLYHASYEDLAELDPVGYYIHASHESQMPMQKSAATTMVASVSLCLDALAPTR